MKRILKTLFFCLTLIVFSSCFNKSNEHFPNNIDKYKEAKEILIKNFEILKERNPNDSSSGLIMYSNKYFFEENLPTELLDLKEITSLWDNNLMEKSPIFGIISVFKDSTIIFTADYRFLGVSGVGHYILYDPNGNKGNLGKKGKGIVYEKEIEDNWIYIIEKKHPAEN